MPSLDLSAGSLSGDVARLVRGWSRCVRRLRLSGRGQPTGTSDVTEPSGPPTKSRRGLLGAFAVHNLEVVEAFGLVPAALAGPPGRRGPARREKRTSRWAGVTRKTQLLSASAPPAQPRRPPPRP
jgi:hypothetical protein